MTRTRAHLTRPQGPAVSGRHPNHKERCPMHIGPINPFANRHIIGFRYRNRWQLDFMFGPWRPLSYRRGDLRSRHRSIDLGRLGVLRWGPLATISVTITPDIDGFIEQMNAAARAIADIAATPDHEEPHP